MIADSDTYNFGTKALNPDTDTVFTIFNTGDADLTLTLPITLGGANADQFSIQAQPVSPIAPTDNTTFTVRFTPTSAGAKTATISIVNNDGDENTFDITLDGTGPAAGGGGGLPPGGTTFTNDLEVSGNTQPLVTDVDGKVQQTVQSTSEDGTVTVTVLKDTVLTDETGDPVHSLSVTV